MDNLQLYIIPIWTSSLFFTFDSIFSDKTKRKCFLKLFYFALKLCSEKWFLTFMNWNLKHFELSTLFSYGIFLFFKAQLWLLIFREIFKFKFALISTQSMIDIMQLNTIFMVNMILNSMLFKILEKPNSGSQDFWKCEEMSWKGLIWITCNPAESWTSNFCYLKVLSLKFSIKSNYLIFTYGTESNLLITNS